MRLCPGYIYQIHKIRKKNSSRADDLEPAISFAQSSLSILGLLKYSMWKNVGATASLPQAPRPANLPTLPARPVPRDHANDLLHMVEIVLCMYVLVHKPDLSVFRSIVFNTLIGPNHLIKVIQ